jgi:hypothetical protein
VTYSRVTPRIVETPPDQKNGRPTKACPRKPDMALAFATQANCRRMLNRPDRFRIFLRDSIVSEETCCFCRKPALSGSDSGNAVVSRPRDTRS